MFAMQEAFRQHRASCNAEIACLVSQHAHAGSNLSECKEAYVAGA